MQTAWDDRKVVSFSTRGQGYDEEPTEKAGPCCG